jgi:vacuolar protein sorting-associated protein 45
MDLLFKKQCDFILSRGNGIKACLFDLESKTIISNLIPYSKFQDNDFFYFDYITNRKRSEISNISCVIIMRPSSLKSLIEELSSPFYCSYIILFTNQIDPFVLEIIANSDIKGRVSEIHEIYLDLYKQSPFLYTTSIDTDNLAEKRKVDGLFSLLMSLDIAPNIKIQCGNESKLNDLSRANELLKLNEQSNMLESIKSNDLNKMLGSNKSNDPKKTGEQIRLSSIGKEINSRIKQYNFKKAGTLIILKRDFDLISPLVYDWHYQSLINEHLQYSNDIVRIPSEKHEYSMNDSFFESNKFKNIHLIGNEIKELVKELERNKIKINNHQFDELEEKASHSAMVEAHLNIYNRISKECMENKTASELEMKVLKSNMSVSCFIEEIDLIFPDRSDNRFTKGSAADSKALDIVSNNDRKILRLILLFIIRNPASSEEIIKKFAYFSDPIKRFLDLNEIIDFPYKPTFNPEKDVKLSYEPPLRRIVRHLIQAKLKTATFENVNEENQQLDPIIVYIDGGISLNEYREAHLYAQSNNISCYFVSDKILSSEKIINSIL